MGHDSIVPSTLETCSTSGRRQLFLRRSIAAGLCSADASNAIQQTAHTGSSDSGSNMGETQHTASASPHRLASIDVLRAVAALAVLFIHIPHFAEGGWRQNPWLVPSLLIEYGYLGVPLFIILSGFCIHLRIAKGSVLGNDYQIDWWRFWLRRFLRLYPPYAAAIVFSLCLAYGIHHRYLAEGDSLAPDLLTHLLLIHNLSERFSLTLGNGAFWSLGAEEQLYLLYMLIASLFLMRRWRLLLVLGATVTVFIRGLDAFEPGFRAGPDAFPVTLSALPFMFWLHWILGAVAVEAACRKIELPRCCERLGVAIWLFAVAGLINPLFARFLQNFRILNSSGVKDVVEDLLERQPWIVGTSRHISDLVFAVGFFVILNWCVVTERNGGFRSAVARLFASIGRMSYSLYLTHVPVLCSCEVLIPFGWTPRDWIIRYFVYSGISFVVAYIFYRVVERPCLKLLTRI